MNQICVSINSSKNPSIRTIELANIGVKRRWHVRIYVLPTFELSNQYQQWISSKKK